MDEITRRPMRRTVLKAGLAVGTGAALVGPSAAGAASGLPSQPQGGHAGLSGRDAAFDAAVWKGADRGQQVWGYVDQHSVRPGETFNLMLSTGPGSVEQTGAIEIYRIGWYGDSDRRLMWRSGVLTVERQTVAVSAAMLSAAWPVALRIDTTRDWPSGYYTVDFIAGGSARREANLAYIVVTGFQRVGDILVVLPTNTYQAYNEWGGVSLYTSKFGGAPSQVVSFDRPPGDMFFHYDYYFVTWLEGLAGALGKSVHYAANFDLDEDFDFTTGYRLVISGCHNEYWSLPEFKQVYRRIYEQGKHTVFMGANSAYWQVRYADADAVVSGAGSRGRQLVCYKSVTDPICQRRPGREGLALMTARFRDGGRWPETMLAGVAYQSYFEATSPVRYSYRVVDDDSPFFQGTGLKNGDTIDGIVGYEWDNTDPEGDGRRLWESGQTHIPLLPRETVKVLFAGDPVDIDGRPGKAEAVYFASPAGGRVFATGSIHWAWGLSKPGFVDERFQRFNERMILSLLS